MVRTFHVAMVVVVLVETMIFGLTASRFWLSPPDVIHLPAGGPSSPRSVMSDDFAVGVSVARVFFTGWGS
jgi:hypothetical protein